MKKVTFLLMGLIFVCSIASNTTAYSFSIIQPVNSSEALKYVKGSEFIKLSFKQFARLTGQKDNLWNNITFKAMKMKVKHDLKKNPNLLMNNYTPDKVKKRLGAGWWILIGAAGAILLLFLIFAIAYGGGF